MISSSANPHNVRHRRPTLIVATGALVLLATACSSSKGGGGASSGGAQSPPATTSNSPSAATTGGSTGGPASSDPFATPNAASGSPVVFGVLNLESGPVTFPEVVQAEKAAVDYVNAYKGGIGGHPIKLVSCVTDGQPSTSQRCANQIADQKPVAILGGADTGAPGAIPVWQRENLAYLGGVPFTPVEENYPNGVLFSSIGSANAAAAVYGAKTLNAKSAAVIYTSDTQGTTSAENDIIATYHNAGITKITKVGIPPTSSDVSSAVATVVGAHPDVVYIDAPAACPAILSSLKQLGNTAKVFGIDPCTSPRAIAGANGGADGMYFASATLDPFAGTPETNLFLAVLKKYAPKDIILDSPASIGFQTVIDVQAALAKFTTADLTTSKILAAFRTGKSVANFMGHDYVCDGKQLAKQTAQCNPFQQIRQVKGTKIVATSTDYLNPSDYYKG